MYLINISNHKQNDSIYTRRYFGRVRMAEVSHILAVLGTNPRSPLIIPELSTLTTIAGTISSSFAQNGGVCPGVVAAGYRLMRLSKTKEAFCG